MKIYVPQLLFPRYIMPRNPIDIGFKLHGEFKFIIKRGGVIIKETAFKDNIITDLGLKHIAALTGESVASNLYYCQLGTGTTTPTSSDTALAAYANYKPRSSGTYSLGSTNDRYMQLQWDYAAGDVVGTWTEVAIAWSTATSGNIFNRMLIADPITTTADDTLTIIYNLHFVRSSDTPTENTITIDAVETVMQSLITDVCLQYITASGGYALHAISNNGRLGIGTGALTTTQTTAMTPIDVNPTIYAVKSYVSEAFYRELYNEWPASVVGTITNGLIYIGGNMPIAFKFGTALVKTDTTKKIRVDSRITYGRAA
jgi:hypothetical protein